MIKWFGVSFKQLHFCTLMNIPSDTPHMICLLAVWLQTSDSDRKESIIQGFVGRGGGGVTVPAGRNVPHM